MTPTSHVVGSLDRLAFRALLILALTLWLGDIAHFNPINAAALGMVRALLPFVIGLTLLATLATRQLPRFPARAAAPVALWLAVLTLSAVLAPSNQSESLASLERPASGALLAWAVFALCRDRHRWRLLAQAIALGGLLVALVGLAEASGMPIVHDWLATLRDGSIPIGDVPRIAATLSHPNVAAIVLELSLPLLVAWAWTSPNGWRVPLATAALANLVAIVLTFSRAGIVAGLASLAIMTGLCFARGERRGVLFLGVTALAVPIALTWAAMADPGLDRRLTASVEQTRPSQPSRVEYWSAAISMLHEYPWLGVGPDNYRWRFASYSGVPTDNLGVHAHDQYLEAVADTGLLGIVALGWLFTRLLQVAVDGVQPGTDKSEWPWRAAVLASLCAWLLHAVLDDFERFWPASVAFWLIAGLVLRLPLWQPAQRFEQALGRIAFADEPAHARPQGLGPLLGAAAQDKQLTAGVGGSQTVELAARAQARQVPIEQDYRRVGARDLVDQAIGGHAISDDRDTGLVLE